MSEPTTTHKQLAQRAIDSLPDDASIEDAMERLLFIDRIERGLREADEDNCIPHEQVIEQVKAKIQQWQT